MFPPIRWDEDSKDYYLKPMNCPHHHKVFAASPRSYRHLPYRIAEYGQVYRYELSGSLHGLSRVRGLCQNDAHIYIDPNDARSEVLSVLDLHEHCYLQLGLKGYRYRLSLGDPNKPQIFQGDLGDWQRAESILREALIERGLSYFEAVGEAAFYGPKIDIQMPMRSGAEESIASIQLDFLSAERFDLGFVGSSGERLRPWVIHRAPLGSHERFVAMLLKYFDGQLPGWLAPVQVAILPAGEAQYDMCRRIQAQLIDAGLRSFVDVSAGSLSKRIRLVRRLRPYAKMAVGAKEESSGILNLEMRDGMRSGALSELIESLREECRVPGG